MEFLHIYTSPKCEECSKLKRYLLNLDINFRETYVDSDLIRNEVFSISNKENIPLIIYKNKFISGFKKDLLDKIIELYINDTNSNQFENKKYNKTPAPTTSYNKNYFKNSITSTTEYRNIFIDENPSTAIPIN